MKPRVLLFAHKQSAGVTALFLRTTKLSWSAQIIKSHRLFVPASCQSAREGKIDKSQNRQLIKIHRLNLCDICDSSAFARWTWTIIVFRTLKSLSHFQRKTDDCETRVMRKIYMKNIFIKFFTRYLSASCHRPTSIIYIK